MTWFRVDDKLHGHVKPLRAGLEAMGAWVLAGSWCGDHLSDGHIPKEVAHKLGPGRAWRRLVDSGMAEVTAEGYSLHDYLEWNPSRAQVEAERGKKQEAGRRGGKAKAAVAESRQILELTASTRLAPASHVLEQTPSACLAPASPLVDPRLYSRPVPIPYPPVSPPSGDVLVLVRTAPKGLPRCPTQTHGGPVPALCRPTRPAGHPETEEAAKRHPGPAEQVFAAFVAARASVLGPSRPPVLDAKRRKLVAARLRDFPIADLIAAADGIWRDAWAVEDPKARISFEIALRDSQHVEKFRDAHGVSVGRNGRTVALEPAPGGTKRIADTMSRLLAANAQ